MLDPDILSAHPCPASRVGTNVQMQKTAVINADSALVEGWNLERQLIHLLQREAGDANVGCQAARVFAVGHAAHFLVVGGAAIPIVNQDFCTGQAAQLLQGVEESLLDSQLAAAAARHLSLGKM